MQLTVQYETRYTYSQPIRRLIQLLRLTPLSFSGQNVLDWRIDVDCDARLRAGRDGYGNLIHMLYVESAIEQLKVEVSGRVLTEDRAGVIGNVPHDLPPLVFLRPTALTHVDRPLAELAAALEHQGGTVLDKLHRLGAHINTRMRFDTSSTDTGTTAGESFSAGHGVCQDFVHIFITIARLIGVPARYISGHYFRRDGAEIQPAAHAWAEAWVEDLGWVAFDPTNGISADDGYIRVAAGLDYQDAAPFAGARSGGGSEELHVAVQVRQTRVQSQTQTQS